MKRINNFIKKQSLARALTYMLIIYNFLGCVFSSFNITAYPDSTPNTVSIQSEPDPSTDATTTFEQNTIRLRGHLTILK
ncbi:MAG: hypothetical protein HYZ14_03250 [Bacteroidetes bacterium]|nr:hypothetical protein [Bacteroidota bacterium]